MGISTAIYCFADLGKVLNVSAKIGPFVCIGCVVLANVAGLRAIATLGDFPEECRVGISANETYWNVWPPLREDVSPSAQIVEIVADVAAYGFYCFAVVVTVPSLKGQMQH